MSTYTPTDWDDYPTGGTRITATKLNKMELGIQGAHVAATQALKQGDDAKAALAAANTAIAAASDLDALELVASRLDMRSGSLRLAVATDSTGNGKGDWPYVLGLKMARRWPHLRVLHRLWDDAAQTYAAPTTLNAGTVLTPASDGQVLVDEFNRSGEPVGSTPDKGPAWTGGAGTATMNGSALTFTAAGSIAANTGQRGGTLAGRITMTTATTTAQQIRLYTAYSTNGAGSGVYVFVGVTTAGAPSVGAYLTVAGSGSRSLGAITGHGIAANSAAPQTVAASVKVDGQNVTVTVGVEGQTPATLTAQITEAEYAALGTSTVVFAGNPLTTMTLDRVSYTGAAKAEEVQTIDIWNGAMPGATFDYQLSRLDVMYPPPTAPGQTTVPTAVLNDTFDNRTGALVGSKPAAGGTWTGADVWTVSAGKVAPNASALGAPSTAVHSAIPRVAGTLTVAGAITTNKQATTTQRYFFGFDGATNGLASYFSVSAAGSPSLGVYARTPSGGVRTLGTLDVSAIPVNSATATPYTLKITVTGLTVTVALTASSRTVTGSWILTQAEADVLAGYQRAGLQIAAGDASDWPIDSITVVQDVETTTGTAGGATFDVLVIAGGHNYAGVDPDTFKTKVSGFVDAYAAKHPESRILVSSQNPETPPASGIVPHALRQVAIRDLARERAWSYVGAFERFAARPDGGASLILDGIHPTTYDYGDATADTYGGNVWAQVALEALVSRSLA